MWYSFPRGVFDHAATKAMGEACDAACKAIYRNNSAPEVVQEAIARIVAAARKVKRDMRRCVMQRWPGSFERSRSSMKTSDDKG